MTDDYDYIGYDFESEDWGECEMKMTEVASRMLVLARSDALPSVEDMTVILNTHTGNVLSGLDWLCEMGYSFQRIGDDNWDLPIRVMGRPATIIQGHVEDPRVRDLEKENASLRSKVVALEGKVYVLEGKIGDALAALQPCGG